MVIQLPYLKTAQPAFFFISILYYKTELNDSTMGDCYSGNHIAGDHTDITKCNTKNYNRSAVLKSSVINFLIG